MVQEYHKSRRIKYVQVEIRDLRLLLRCTAKQKVYGRVMLASIAIVLPNFVLLFYKGAKEMVHE
jgi:hypothetical protein